MISRAVRSRNRFDASSLFSSVSQDVRLSSDCSPLPPGRCCFRRRVSSFYLFLTSSRAEWGRAPLAAGWTIVACVLQPRLLRGESGDSQISSNARYTHGTSPFDLGFTARVLFFGLYAAVGLVFAVVSLLISSPAPCVHLSLCFSYLFSEADELVFLKLRAFYQAVGGIVAVIVFGTQRVSSTRRFFPSSSPSPPRLMHLRLTILVGLIRIYSNSFTSSPPATSIFQPPPRLFTPPPIFARPHPAKTSSPWTIFSLHLPTTLREHPFRRW